VIGDRAAISVSGTADAAPTHRGHAVEQRCIPHLSRCSGEVIMSERLSLFSYEILGLVGRNGAGPHDLVRLARRDRMLAWPGERQYYLEPRRLARLGYLTAREAPGRTHPRTLYTLTDQGIDALAAWAREPVHFVPFKSEAMVRLLVADLVGEPLTRTGIAALLR
jgi:DNA-binding PadR family transcriptional regulator